MTHCPGLYSITLKHKTFLEPQNVTIFRSKVVADVISLNDVILEEGGPFIQSDWCPLGQTQREGDHVEAGAEHGILKLDCQGAAIRKQGRGVDSACAQGSPRRKPPFSYFDFILLAFLTVKE